VFGASSLMCHVMCHVSGQVRHPYLRVRPSNYGCAHTTRSLGWRSHWHCYGRRASGICSPAAWCVSCAGESPSETPSQAESWWWRWAAAHLPAAVDSSLMCHSSSCHSTQRPHQHRRAPSPRVASPQSACEWPIAPVASCASREGPARSPPPQSAGHAPSARRNGRPPTPPQTRRQPRPCLRRSASIAGVRGFCQRVCSGAHAPLSGARTEGVGEDGLTPSRAQARTAWEYIPRGQWRARTEGLCEVRLRDDLRDGLERRDEERDERSVDAGGGGDVLCVLEAVERVTRVLRDDRARVGEAREET
jgi:hypothetical protein